MLLHRVSGEFIVIGLSPIGSASVNQQHDGHGGVTAYAVEELPIGVVAQFRWYFPPQVTNGPADSLHLAEDIGVEPGAARIADLLLPLSDVEQILGHAAFGAEQIDLEDHHVIARSGSLEHEFERRV